MQSRVIRRTREGQNIKFHLSQISYTTKHLIMIFISIEEPDDIPFKQSSNYRDFFIDFRREFKYLSGVKQSFILESTAK